MPAKKTAVKKGKMGRAAMKKAPAQAKKITNVKKAFTKGQILNYIAERAVIKRAQAGQAMIALNELMEVHLKKSGPGAFAIPGVMKMKVVRKPATKERKGVNPFTGEPTTFKAKPARNIVKIRPLKKLKDSVA